MKALVFLQLAVLGLWTIPGAFAQVYEQVQLDSGRVCPCYVVNSVVIEGAFRTRHEVIEREFLFVAGALTDKAEIEESIQRLRNTGLFRTVDYELIESVGEHRELRVSVDERWTLLPAGRIGFGGGVTHLMLGASDANLFGSYLQLGGQFSRTGPANSFLVWFGDPRFLNERISLTTEVSLSNRQLVFYEPNGEIDGSFLMTRKYARVELEKEWHRWWRTSVKLGVNADSFSYQLIPEEYRLQQDAGDGLPDSQSELVLGLSSRWGRLNFDNYRVDGTQFLVQWMQTLNVPQVSSQGFSVDASLLRFATLWFKSTLGLRLNLGFSTHTQEHQKYFLGGLDAVRGFENQRFRGSFFWLGNLEYRIPSVDTRWLAIQHVVFFDALGVSDYAFEMWGLSGASVGVGLRFMSPKIHGFIGRIGYAFNLYGGAGPGLSMGGGQFF